MKAVIIAGGLGTRLRPLTYDIPKPIVPVANKPFVLYQIELLKKCGITEIILNLHYLPEKIGQLFNEGEKLGIKMHYSIEEHPLGTAGAVKNAEEYFDDEPLVVFNGDILTDIDLKRIIDFHRQKKATATLTLTRVEDPTTYGLIITDSEGKIERFIEKPHWEQVTTNTINAGIYVLDPKIFKKVPRKKECSFERELFPSLLRDGELLYGIEDKAFWLDIGNPAKYRLAHQAILQGEVKVDVPGKKVEGHIWLGNDLKISATAKIYGPAIIGNRCQIKDTAKIAAMTVLGEGVSVGEGAEIEGSIIWEGTKIGKEVKLKGCIVGANCIIEDFASLGGDIVLADRTIIKKGTKIG